MKVVSKIPLDSSTDLNSLKLRGHKAGKEDVRLDINLSAGRDDFQAGSPEGGGGRLVGMGPKIGVGRAADSGSFRLLESACIWLSFDSMTLWSDLRTAVKPHVQRLVSSVNMLKTCRSDVRD